MRSKVPEKLSPLYGSGRGCLAGSTPADAGEVGGEQMPIAAVAHDVAQPD